MSQLSNEFKKNSQYNDDQIEKTAASIAPRLREEIDKTIVSAGMEAANKKEQLENTREDRVAALAAQILARRDQPIPTLHPAGLRSRRVMRPEEREKANEEARNLAERAIDEADRKQMKDQEAQFRERLRAEVEKALKQETRSERAAREAQERQSRGRGRDRDDYERER